MRKTIENTIVDEIHNCTFVVKAGRTLTDGEVYSAIRVEMLKRGGKFPAKGETFVINSQLS
jgi:hypothetical protein